MIDDELDWDYDPDYCEQCGSSRCSICGQMECFGCDCDDDDEMTEYIRVRKDVMDYNDQVNEINIQTIKDLLKQKQDLIEWLEEEINKLNPKRLELGELNLMLDDIRFYSYIQLKEVLERLVGE